MEDICLHPGVATWFENEVVFQWVSSVKALAWFVLAYGRNRHVGISGDLLINLHCRVNCSCDCKVFKELKGYTFLAREYIYETTTSCYLIVY